MDNLIFTQLVFDSVAIVYVFANMYASLVLNSALEHVSDRVDNLTLKVLRLYAESPTKCPSPKSQ